MYTILKPLNEKLFWGSNQLSNRSPCVFTAPTCKPEQDEELPGSVNPYRNSVTLPWKVNASPVSYVPLT